MKGSSSETKDDIGERFWDGTKHRRDNLRGTVLDWESRPETYKVYADRKVVKLPQPPRLGSRSFDEVVRLRHSGRTYSTASLTLADLSYILWTSNGINRKERGMDFRNVPSAGALYPIETYICINRVEGLELGIYHHRISDHAIELIVEGDQGSKLARAALDQRMVEESAATIIWSAVFPRSRWKYGQRCYRYVLLDAGHIAQNLALASTAIGLACCHIAAFYDDEVNSIIGLDGAKESAVYMSSVGYPR